MELGEGPGGRLSFMCSLRWRHSLLGLPCICASGVGCWPIRPRPLFDLSSPFLEYLPSSSLLVPLTHCPAFCSTGFSPGHHPTGGICSQPASRPESGAQAHLALRLALFTQHHAAETFGFVINVLRCMAFLEILGNGIMLDPHSQMPAMVGAESQLCLLVGRVSQSPSGCYCVCSSSLDPTCF